MANNAPLPPSQALSQTPLYKRFVLMAGEAGLLSEVGPRRFMCAKGRTHVISAAAIRHALDAGLLYRIRVRCYRLGEGLKEVSRHP